MTERRARIVTSGPVPADVVRALGRLADVRASSDAEINEDDDLVVLGAGGDLAAFAAALRERSPDRWIPLLVIGSEALDLSEVLDGGADDVVPATAPVEQLLARATVLLKLKARHDELAARATQFTDWTRTLVGRVTEQVEERERLERLRRFLSPEVAEVVAGDERLLQSHRQEIAAVFCDLRGFTSFAEETEPEEVMRVLREYHRVLGELIFRFGATLERFAGDSIFAFFNDPVPCPDPAPRAVRMAVAMRERVRALVPGWRRLGYELDLSVGIALGHATLGRVGFERRFDYGAVGSVVSLAARLCAEAAGGQILISEPTFALADEMCETESVAPLQLKGFRRSTAAYNVIGLRNVDRDATPPPQAAATSLGSPDPE